MAETKKIKVLLIDDNEVVRIFFKDIFWIHGLEEDFELQVAEGVEGARKILSNPDYSPDVVFLDLVMPIEINGKNTTTPEAGLTILKEIRENPRLSGVSVFVFSAYAEPEVRERAAKLGATKFLAKEEHLPQDLVKILSGMTSEKVFQ